MALSVQNLIDRAGIILHDTTQVRWQETELLDWLNDAQREIVLIRPDSSVESKTLVLDTGTKQKLQDDFNGIRILDIVRNTTAGAVRVIDRNVLDAQQPDWHLTPVSSVVEHFMFDLRDPKRFYVYPSQPATGMGSVEIVFSSSPVDATLAVVADPAAVPPIVAADDSGLTLDDVYANAVLDYILYRAYSKDADFAGNAQRALKHHEAFVTSLGLKFKVDQLIDPNTQDNPVPAQQ
jgi:hypothetical protein